MDFHFRFQVTCVPSGYEAQIVHSCTNFFTSRFMFSVRPFSSILLESLLEIVHIIPQQLHRERRRLCHNPEVTTPDSRCCVSCCVIIFVLSGDFYMSNGDACDAQRKRTELYYD